VNPQHAWIKFYEAAVEEAGDPHRCGDWRSDRTGSNSAGSAGGGREAQPHDDWVGQLLLSRASPQSLSNSRSHARKRLRQWLCAKHTVWGLGTKRLPDASLHQLLGFVCLNKRTRNIPWATS